MKMDNVIDKNEIVLVDVWNPDVSIVGITGGGKSTYRKRLNITIEKKLDLETQRIDSTIKSEWPANLIK